MNLTLRQAWVSVRLLIVMTVLLGVIYPAFNSGLTALGNWVVANTIIGGLVYGTLNRLLIPLGLHHILNSVPWFVFGEYTAADGQVYHGDIARFLHGDPAAGPFMTGFFPIMMFGLPGAALAIYHSAKKENKEKVASIMIAAAFASFIESKVPAYFSLGSYRVNLRLPSLSVELVTPHSVFGLSHSAAPSCIPANSQLSCSSPSSFLASSNLAGSSLQVVRRFLLRPSAASMAVSNDPLIARPSNAFRSVRVIVASS